MFRGTCILALLSLLLGFSSASAYSFRDFRIPDHRVFSSGANADGWYSWTHSTNNDDVEKRTNLNGSISGRLRWLRDSDTFRTLMLLSANADNSRQATHTDDTVALTVTEDKNINASRSAVVVWSGWYYPGAVPVGVSGEAVGKFNHYEYKDYHVGKWNSDGFDHVHKADYGSESDQRRVTLDLGITYGRVRDATTVYQALIMERRLREDGVIADRLQPATIQRIADLLYDRPEYGYQYERPDRFFWRDIESALKADPAFSADAFDANALYRLDENVADQPWVERQQGFSIGPAISALHSFNKGNHLNRELLYHTSPDSSSSDTTNYSDTRSKYFDDSFRIGIKALYHLPLNLRWQLDFISSLWNSIEPENDGLSFQATAYTTYEIAERWRANLRTHYYRLLSDPQEDDPSYYYRWENSWTVDLDLNIRYYIESKTAIYLSTSFSTSGQSYELATDEPITRELTSEGFGFSLGIEYSFTGYADYFQELYLYGR